MQLRSVPRRQQRQHAPRARREDRSCRRATPRCVSPTNHRLKPHPKRAASARSVSRSRDPIGYEGSPWNLYEYLNGLPLLGTDPTGQVSLLNCGQRLINCKKAAFRAWVACNKAHRATIACAAERQTFETICATSYATCQMINRARLGARCILMMITPPGYNDPYKLPDGTPVA